MSDIDARLVIRFESEQPFELSAMTASLSALAEEYRRQHGGEGAVLVVERMSEGSIVAVLRGVCKAALTAIDPTGGALPFTLDTIAPFTGHWSGLLTALANYSRAAGADGKAREYDRASLLAASAFVQPAINGNPIHVIGDGNQISQVNLKFDAETAGDIVRNVRHLLGAIPGEDQRFENEPMALYQLRDAVAGDLGFIDRFDTRPRRLTFANEAVKHAIIHGQARPFDVFFFVSGIAKTARGDIASYLIERIDGVTEKDAA